MFPNRVPTERDTPTPQPLVYLFVHVCQSPQKKDPSFKMAKNIRSPSMEPHAGRRPTYSGVRPGSPRGMLMTLLSPPHCHATLGTIPSTLGWVDRTPLASVCCSNPQQGIPSTHVTTSHMTKGRVEYESTIPQGMDEGLDLWEAKYWLQDLKERDQSGNCTVIKSGFYRKSTYMYGFE